MPEETAPKKATMNYQPNSHKAKAKAEEARKPKVERVVSENAIQRKTPLGRKVRETMTGDDMQTVGNYILFDVVIPAAKAMISDAASQGVERMLFGDSSRRVSAPRTARTGYTSYNRMSSPGIGRAGEPDGPRSMSYKARATHDFGEVLIPSRGEAEEVIERLGDLINDYDVATVADLYDLVGITGSFADDKWGWTDIRGAGIGRTRDGYLLNLPKPTPLD